MVSMGHLHVDQQVVECSRLKLEEGISIKEGFLKIT